MIQINSVHDKTLDVCYFPQKFNDRNMTTVWEISQSIDMPQDRI